MSGNGGHPAWQELLKELPESLHPLVTPVLQKWDQGVQQTLEAKTQELKKYEAYKQFVDNNVDPEWLVEAADLAYRFQNNPKEVLDQANQVWDLGYVTKDQAAQLNQSGGDSGSSTFEDDPDMQDITNHPLFKAMNDKLEQLTGQVTEFTSQTEAEKQQQEWDKFLKKQHDDGKQFDDDFVTALVANGASFDQAVDRYNDLVASVVGDGSSSNNDEQAGQSTSSSGDSTAPVVMGGDGAGSGLPDQPIAFDKMKQGDLEDTVAQMIAQMNAQ